MGISQAAIIDNNTFEDMGWVSMNRVAGPLYKVFTPPQNGITFSLELVNESLYFSQLALNYYWNYVGFQGLGH